VVANQTLYYYSSISAEPENIVTLSKSVDRLAIGGHNVMAYSTQMPDAMEDIASAYSAYAIDPILINESTKAQHIFANGPIADASLSPDGKWATIMPRGSSKTNIYTVETGTRAYQIFNPAYALAWTSDSTFAYSVGQSLWLFDVNGKSGHIEGKIGQGSEITSLSYTAGQGYFTAAYDGPDQAYIYYIPSESKAP